MVLLAVVQGGGVAQAASFLAFESGPVRPLAKSPDGSRLFAVNTPDNRLEIFDIDGLGLTHVASVSVGMEPVAVAARNNSEVWVVNHLSDSISVVDVSSSPARVTRTLLVGDEPRDIVFAGSGGNRAFITTAHRGQNSGTTTSDYVTAGQGRADVWVFDATNLGSGLGGTPVGKVTLFGDTPRALTVSNDGNTVYAAIFHSGNQSTVVSEGAVCDTSGANLNSDVVQGPCTIFGVSVPGGLPLPHRSADGALRPEVGLIVKWNGAHWVDAACQAGINAGKACTMAADCPSSTCGRIWDNAVKFSLPDKDVFTINANTLAQTSFFTGVGTILFNMVTNPMTGKVYVSNGEANNLVRFEGPGTLAGSTVQGNLLQYRISVLDGGGVTARHLNKHINYGVLPAPAGVKDHSLATPLDMAVTANGQTLYVAAFGSSKIGVFSTAQLEDNTFTPSSASHISVNGGGPAGLVLDEDNDRLYALTRFDNGIAVIDTDTNTEVSHLSLHNPEPAAIINGRRFLYDAHFTSSNGEASCSSCHIFGDLDDLAWDLGNPDDEKIPNPLPIRLKEVAQLGGSTNDFDNFHPMKGPMTTQTLRGMQNHGAMHWRGDRVDQDGDLFNADISFRNFRGAFPGLLGRAAQIPESDMQAFSDFILQVYLPPNPIRNLDGTLTADQQAGRGFMTGPRRSDGSPFDAFGLEAGFQCVGCHVLDPSQGFFGADGRQSFEGETQIIKTAHLRNMYQKVGMFGMTAVDFFLNSNNGAKGDQIRGFGFLHDGSVDTMFRFLRATVFENKQTFPFSGQVGFDGPAGPDGHEGDIKRRQVEQFLLAFDSDLAAVVGQQITLTSTNAATVGPRIDLLMQRAAAAFTLKGSPGARECDLIVKGTVAGAARGWVLEGGSFRSDKVAESPLSDASLRALATTPGQELTYTCVPPGSGVRSGIDRDLDHYLDADETAGGTDPADSSSQPGPSMTPTITGTTTPTRTPTMTPTSTPTSQPSATATPTIGCTGGNATITSLKLKITNNPSPAGDEGFTLSGSVVLSGAIDPVSAGLQLRMMDRNGTTVYAKVVPAGAQPDSRSPGWKVSRSGVRWIYKSSTGTQAGGVRKVIIADRSSRTAGLHTFKITGKAADFQITGGEAPPSLIIELASDTCAAGIFNTGTTVRPFCSVSTSGQTLSCR